jgi:hypothetical protein
MENPLRDGKGEAAESAGGWLLELGLRGSVPSCISHICAESQRFRAYWPMPLWLTLPTLLLLGASSWISTLDPTGAPGVNFLLWGGTVVAASLVVLRLLRIA